MRVGGGLDVGRFQHQPLVDRHAAGGVEHHHVVAAETSRFHGAAGDLHGTLARNDRQGIDADLLAKDRQLFLRRRSPRIERGHQHAALVAPGEALGDLRRGGGLARALQADHQDADRRRRIEVDHLRVRTEHVHELIVDDLDDLLSGRHRTDDFRPDRPRPYFVGEGPHDVEGHIRLEQGAAHLAKRGVDILLGERAAARQTVEDGGEFVGKALEHVYSIPFTMSGLSRSASALSKWLVAASNLSRQPGLQKPTTASR